MLEAVQVPCLPCLPCRKGLAGRPFLRRFFFLGFVNGYPPRKLTWPWHIHHLKMHFLLKIRILNCHVSFREVYCPAYGARGGPTSLGVPAKSLSVGGLFSVSSRCLDQRQIVQPILSSRSHCEKQQFFQASSKAPGLNYNETYYKHVFSDAISKFTVPQKTKKPPATSKNSNSTFPKKQELTSRKINISPENSTFHLPNINFQGILVFRGVKTHVP